MSIQVTACLNPFSGERKEFSFEQGITINEIIRNLDALNAVNTGWRVMIDDEIITDFERVPEEGQRVYIKLVPEGDNKDTGAGMKIAGGLLSVVGAILAFTPASALGFCLIGCGVGMFAGGVVLYNTDIPSLTDREKPEQDPSIRGSRNQMRPYGKVPVLLGKRRIYADACANPYTWVDSDGAIWLHQLFCVAQKDIQIDTSTLKIDETLLKDYSATGDISRVLDQSNPDPLIQMKISYGDSTPPLYDKCVHEIQLNTVLKHQTEDEQDGSVIRTTPAKTTKINVDVFFYNGLGKYNDEGNVVSTSVELKAEYKKSTDPDSAYQLLGYFSEGSNTISGSELKTKRYAITKDNLTADSYTVKISRVTADSTDTKIIDTVYVGSIRAANNDTPVRSARCQQVTLIGLKIKASEKLNNIVEQLNFVAQSRMPVYNSQSHQWTNALTSNPASAAMYAMQGEVAQQRLSNSDIDLDSFAALYDWCGEHDYECNAYITDDITINDLLSSIASTCRAEILRMNGKITVIQDIEKDSFVQLFTPRNSHNYKETMALADIPDVLKMGIVDKTNGYAENEVPVYNTPSGNPVSGVEPQTSQSVPLWGVTDSVQARKLGMYNYAVSKHRFTIVSFSCDFEYLMCRKGDWIKYAGDIALAGLKQGRIEAVDGQKLILDEQVTMENGKSYAVRIRKSDGTAALYNVQTVAGTSNEITISGQIPSNVEGCLFAFGLTGNETRDLIVTDIQCGDNLSADLTCVEYAPEIFGVDNPDFVLPDFVNKLSDTDCVYDDGNVTGDEFYQKSLETMQALISGRYANHIVTLYKYSETDLPSSGIGTTCVYDFSTDTITWGDPSLNNGWSVTVPSDLTDVWVTSATAHGQAQTDTIQSNEWARPIKVGQNGVNGLNTCTISLYKRLSSTPQDLPAKVTYNFEYASMACSNWNGWSASIPPIDENNTPCWEIHATALSTSTTDTIESNEWSECAKILSEGLSKQDVLDLIGERINETPNVLFTPSEGVFAVDEDGIVSTPQTAFMDVRVIQNDEDITFSFGQIDLPAGMTVSATVLEKGTRLNFTVAQGTRLKRKVIKVPVIFTDYADNDVLVDEDGNPLVWVADEDGRWYGEFNTVASLPSAVSGGFIYWKGIDTTASEELVEGGVFYEGTFYTYNGTKWKESEIVPLGIQTQASNPTTYDVYYTASIVKGGRYDGKITTVASIPSNPVIGDYFAWVGADNTPYEGSGFTQLKSGCIYKWNGQQYEKENTGRHLGTALPDLLQVAEAELAQNNSDVILSIKKMIAWETVTENLKVTGSALINSTITAELVLGKKPNSEEYGYFISENYSEVNNTGFKLDGNGKAVLNEVVVRGDIYAKSLTLIGNAKIPVSKVDGISDYATESSVETLSSRVDSVSSRADEALLKLSASWGVCNSAKGAVNKTVNIEGFTLYTGARITVEFLYGNSAKDATLNVSNTGEKYIYIGGFKTDPDNNRCNWGLTTVVSLIYNGYNWDVEDNGARDLAVQAERDSKNNLAYKLGYSDWSAMESAARLENTLIDGGLIRTSLIDVAVLWANIASIGTLDAANATIKDISISGNLNLVCGGNAIFSGRTIIEGDAVFKGNIESGPLSLTNDKPPERPDTVITIQANAALRQSFSGGSGTYKNFTFSYANYSHDPLGYTDPYEYMKFYSQNGTLIYSQSARYNQLKAETQLVYTIKHPLPSDSRTFRLTDLPTEKPAGEGYVYRNGNYLMIS